MTIEIDQHVVITRTAFRATLKIENMTDTPLLNVLVSLDIRDADGNPANDRFDGLGTPTLSDNFVISGNGGGTVPPCASSSCTQDPPCCPTAQWLLIPGYEAAPSPATAHYSVGGRFSYTKGGVLTVIPLFPVPIDVMPDAKLFLSYYLQSPVYSDNPFPLPDGTNPIEPAEPFSLGLLVRNQGFGTARNMTIASAEPKITRNDGGLLIAFQMIGTQLWTHIDKIINLVTTRVVSSPPVSPSLTVNLGDIQPNESAVARWLMTSTLQGIFKDYQATFQHTNPLGVTASSLIEKTEIFELNHVVMLDGPDNLPDFLVDYRSDANNGLSLGCLNDLPHDFLGTPPPGDEKGDDLPDCVHSSDGSIVNIQVFTNDPPRDAVTTTGAPTADDLNVPLVVTVPKAGWIFVRAKDPSGGDHELGQVVRAADGKTLNGDFNVWTTHRWVTASGGIDEPPVRQEHRVYLFDHIDTPGAIAYTLMYKSGLTVTGVTINGGAKQRSAITRVSVGFSSPPNIPSLIADGSVTTAVTIWPREEVTATAGSDPASGRVQRRLVSQSGKGQVPLEVRRFSWDALTNTLNIDLTRSSSNGITSDTILEDGNYELHLDTKVIKLNAGTAKLLDNKDGVDDGVYIFGTQTADAFYRFAGDGNGDRVVNDADLSAVEAAWLKSVGDLGYNAGADGNADHIVNFLDLQLVRSNFGQELPFK